MIILELLRKWCKRYIYVTFPALNEEKAGLSWKFHVAGRKTNWILVICF